MRIRMNLFVAILAFSFSGYSLAEELINEKDVIIKRLGSHTGNVFYVSLEQGFSKNCEYSLAYCRLDNVESCKGMLSLALTAKSLNKVRPDFRYMFDPETNKCSIWLISLD